MMGSLETSLVASGSILLLVLGHADDLGNCDRVEVAECLQGTRISRCSLKIPDLTAEQNEAVLTRHGHVHQTKLHR